MVAAVLGSVVGAVRGAVPLTRRGWAVLAVAVVAYTGGVLAGYPVLRALAGVALGALVAAVALTVRRPRVDVARDLYPDRVERGRPALATLHVRNSGGRWQPALTAWDVAGAARERVAVRRLAPGAEATYRYRLSTARRGLLPVGPLVLERADPLRLARRGLTAGGRTTLWVHPKRHPARAATGGRPRHHHEGRTTDDSLRGSADVRDVRPYVVGDEVRHVHWKATARTGQLMVRNHVDPDQPRLSLLLDTRPGALSPDAFEEAVEVAATLAFSATMAGHRCRLLTPDGVDLLPAVGPAAARVLLDALTTVGQADTDLPALPAVVTAGRSGGGAFVVVSGAGSTGSELAPLITRYRALTVLAIDPTGGATGVPTTGVPTTGKPTATEPTAGKPGLPAGRVRRIAAPSAVAAIAEWNASGAGGPK